MLFRGAKRAIKLSLLFWWIKIQRERTLLPILTTLNIQVISQCRKKHNMLQPENRLCLTLNLHLRRLMRERQSKKLRGRPKIRIVRSRTIARSTTSPFWRLSILTSRVRAPAASERPSWRRTMTRFGTRSISTLEKCRMGFNDSWTSSESDKMSRQSSVFSQRISFSRLWSH